MNDKQRAAIKAHMHQLVDALQYGHESFFNNLRLAEVINADHRDRFKRCSTTREMLIDLFELLEHTDSGWNLTIAHLISNNQLKLAQSLKETAEEMVSQFTTTMKIISFG